MKFRRLMQLPVEGQAYQRAALCVTAKIGPLMTLWIIHVESTHSGPLASMSASLCSRPMQGIRCRPSAANWRFVPAEAMGHLVRHPGGVVGNHEPAVAPLLVNLGLDDGKAESLTALVFAFDARDTGRRRRSLIDVDLRRLFRR